LPLEVFTQRNSVETFFHRSLKTAEFSWLCLNEPTDLSRFWVKDHEK